MSTAVETDKMAALATAANEARGLAMDSIAAAHSGHMGLPLGAAEIGASLYGSQVRCPLCLLLLSSERDPIGHEELLLLSFVDANHSSCRLNSHADAIQPR